MAKNNIASVARAFSGKWSGQGYEKGQTQQFWMELLQKVLGVEDPYSFIQFEGQVKQLNATSFMDAYIASTKVLIEQKSIDKDLSKPVPQSGGGSLTPFEQAKKYVVEMPLSKHPRWVVTCNFREFRVYDMENPQGDPEIIQLVDLEKEYFRLQFLVDNSKELHKKEVEVSMAAGAIIGEIYEALHKEYKNPDDPHSLRSLNIICVRLVFCLYAEDAGLFDSHTQFHDYLVQFKPGTGDMRRALIDLFDVLNTPEDKRDPYLRDDLRAFPYVNGGLFAEKDIEIPRFNERIATLLLKHASSDFDWSIISPTIFGGVFESTLNPETRRMGGMYYTSIENIHKVIDPLFLDDLKEELADIKAEPIEKKRIARAKEFQDKIASLKFLDPACGSGNFLTETFLSLRRLENECLRIIYKGNMILGDFVNPIKVSISQFYGIEINDFAVSVAMTALWIAEAQMLFETESLMRVDLDFLPLKSYTNIHEGNALRMDWNEVVKASELNYCYGNPPFLGYNYQTEEQKDDLLSLKVINGQNIDYVVGWYYKSALYAEGNASLQFAFVPTNSITQGDQVLPVWKGLFEDFGIHINFAYRTFKWDSEASLKAHVHCVIIGFSKSNTRRKIIFDGNRTYEATQINGYLLDASPSIIIHKAVKPLIDVPPMLRGSIPQDDNNFVLTKEEKEAMVFANPACAKFIRKYIMGDDFLNGGERYCLWLQGAEPSELLKCPEILERVEKVRVFRQNSKREATRKNALIPTLFGETRICEGSFIAMPTVSSGIRKYIPADYLSSNEAIAGSSIKMIGGATLYHFGLVMSSVHMAWVNTVCGRLKSDYNYSNTLVYNTLPWPSPTDAQKAKIEETAQAILDARALYSESSLADMYDDLAMPLELRKAHRANDAAVMKAYGFRKDMAEAEIVAELFKMYQKLVLGN